MPPASLPPTSIPADMVDHFPLLHNSENLQEATAFAHIVKDNSNSWTLHRTSRSVTIPTAKTELSFFYQNPESGTVTKVYNTYETVADTVYLEYLHSSVLHVECGLNSTLSITFNTSFLTTDTIDSFHTLTIYAIVCIFIADTDCKKVPRNIILLIKFSAELRWSSCNPSKFFQCNQHI